MRFELDIFPIILAGLMNGSFIVPLKLIKNLTNERIWILHSILGLNIIPWTIMMLFFSDSMHCYSLLSLNHLSFLLLCGFIFGIGQVCFAYAIEKIGIALSFTINLSIGVLLGSMFVIFYRHSFFTNTGMLTSLATFLIILSLCLSYYSQHKTSRSSFNRLQYSSGWLLAFFAGLASGLQNIAFMFLLSNYSSLVKSLNSFWIWPPFLSLASISMLYGFSYKNKRKLNSVIENNAMSAKNALLLLVMGFFFTGSLALYSAGIVKIDPKHQIVAWPLLMISIILTSQWWGFLFDKNGLRLRESINRCLSIILLIFAIIILTIR